MNFLSALLAALLVLAGAAPAGAQKLESLAAPDSFGLGEQVLDVPAADFQHTNNKSGYEYGLFGDADGYLHYTDAAYLGHFIAPLILPAGAQIFAMCTYFLDSDSGAAVSTSLEAVKLAVGTAIAPGVVTVIPWYDSGIAYNAGYDVVCIDSNYTYHNTGDVDGDGANEDVVHQLRVTMTESGAGQLAFGGVRVFWRRQISPAPLGATYADVPPSDLAHAYIEALAAAGIASHCRFDGSTLYFCPDDPVTRRQAAVFLTRALGLYWPY